MDSVRISDFSVVLAEKVAEYDAKTERSSTEGWFTRVLSFFFLACDICLIAMAYLVAFIRR